MGYHKRKIPRGVYGHFSKIEEEFIELKDAWEQDDNILQLCELSDLYGAIEQYVWYRFDMEMEDLKKFSDKTKQAFKDGSR
jgi:hypothetical protein